MSLQGLLVELVVKGAVLPALLTLCVLAVPRWRRRRAEASGGAPASALALGLGYVAGHWAVVGLPAAFPPPVTTDWLIGLALAAMLLGLIDGSWPAPSWARWENRTIVTVATLWLVLGPLTQSDWKPPDESTWPVSRAGMAWLVSLGVGMLVFWTSLEALAARLLGAAMPLLLVILASGCAGVLLTSGTIVHGRLALVVAVCLGAVAVWSWLDPRLTLARGGAAVAAVLLAGIGLDGHFYAEVPSSVPFLLLAVAPVVGLMAARRGLPPRHQALASSTAVLVMVALAVTIAVAHQLPEKVEEGP